MMPEPPRVRLRALFPDKTRALEVAGKVRDYPQVVALRLGAIDQHCPKPGYGAGLIEFHLAILYPLHGLDQEVPDVRHAVFHLVAPVFEWPFSADAGPI
uniref:Uncharacterized protein n=1 Tax=Candidatus Kentrum sp. UNK TaxID=2126344 RepID=A0A451ARL3_9GAMM|nr:MAG: hypothetical protein BECKUNK1418G_GA0071005_100552 [Candidatus Kentron sp. UNK]VFK68637.1 MAG: hypothetical protein BECKUNK1418H_GA0071006_100452 [Candidatus Kentron sp. UNK]